MKALTVLLLIFITSQAWAEDAALSRLAEYAKAVGQPFSIERGQQLWTQKHSYSSGVKQRSCASCHGEDLHLPGKHARTGKRIDPMSRVTNPAALTDEKKIEKWFKRNCKWTMGRECSVQEKGDVVSYLLNGAGK